MSLRCALTSLSVLLVASSVFADDARINVRADGKPGYRLLAADKGRVAIVGADGKVEWEVANKAEVHDLWLLPNGNVLLPVARNKVAELNRDKEVVWEYESKPIESNKKHVEIHAFQPLEDGRVMIAESGNGRIVEVDRAGKIVHVVQLTIEHPDPHRDTRMARKLKNGTYLVCHEGDGKIREYAADGKVVWSYTLDLGDRPRSPGHGPEGHGTEVYGAVRLKNGHTLVAGGNNNRVLEVDPEGKVVWSVDQTELPGITLAWVTTLHVLPSGNVIIGNCHAGEKNPQLIEVNRDKQVVWQFRDFETFGNGLASSHVVDLPKGTIR
ncbi:MAG: PQQ-binding-like beta-propeller repeat protein [Planctomycetota bacterium]|nr:PQQ-binding-like beta-propeller repeat protein [Planctomycetota bacterium]